MLSYISMQFNTNYDSWDTLGECFSYYNIVKYYANFHESSISEMKGVRT